MTYPEAIEVLELPRGADFAAARRNYRRLVKKYHPDRVRDPGKKKAAQQRFLLIRDAYELISDNPHLLAGAARSPQRRPARSSDTGAKSEEFAELIRRYRDENAPAPTRGMAWLRNWLESGDAFTQIWAGCFLLTLWLILVWALLSWPK